MQSKKHIQQLSLVQDPQKVKVLILTDQRTSYTDFYFITKFNNVIKLDISYNKISGFTVGFNFRGFASLRTLFLHYNRFSSLRAVQSISQCLTLEYLTMFGNPLEETKTRHYFVNQLLNLKLMDDKIVKMEQRNPQILPTNNNMAYRLSFPIIPVEQSKGSASILAAVIIQLRIIREKYLEANKIIKIQRWYRKMLRKRNINFRRDRNDTIRNSQKQQSVIRRLQTDMKQQIEQLNQIQNLSRQLEVKKQQQKQRLITEKLAINNSKQQKILSLLLMNMECISFMRQKSYKKVFALKQFCEINRLKFEHTKLLCLRKFEKNIKEQQYGAGYLQILLQSSQNFLLRRCGSQQSMNLHKKYSILTKILQKRKKRQSKKFRAKYLNQKPNQQLFVKIKKLQQSYLNKFVLVTQQPIKIFQLLRKFFHKSLTDKTPFPFCLEEIVERSAAAVSIQRIWRGYTVRKKLFNCIQKLAKNNSAWLIQRFIRNLGLKKRNRLFIQLIDYIKKQKSSNQLIIKMQDVLKLQNQYKKVLTGINFKLPDQKIGFKIDHISSKVYIDKFDFLKFPSYLHQYIPNLNIQGVNKNTKQCQNLLDLLFKGVKSVKYLQLSKQGSQYKQTTKKKKQKQYSPDKVLLTSRSLSALANSGVIVINKKIKKQEKNIGQPVLLNQSDHQHKQKQSILQHNYAILEYHSVEELINRKFLLALITFEYKNNRFIKSAKFNLNNNAAAIKNIGDRVQENFIISKIPDQEEQQNEDKYIKKANNETSFPITNFHERITSYPIKLKFYVTQKEFPLKIQILYPASLSKQLKGLGLSQTMPVRNNSLSNSNNQQVQRMIRNKNYQSNSIQSRPQGISNKNYVRLSAQITKNNIKMYPNQKTQQKQDSNYQGNFMSYRQFEIDYQKKYKYGDKSRYDDLQYTHAFNSNSNMNTNRSLQKSHSFQPPKPFAEQDATVKPSQNTGSSNYKVSIYNSIISHTQNLRRDQSSDNYAYNENIQSCRYTSKPNIEYSSLLESEKMLKKTKISLIKQSHRQRVQENNRYKRQEINRLRDKLNDQLQQNNRIIQNNKLESILSNARRRDLVRQALSGRRQDMKSFQRDFLKRGNSSIRKDMIKFQQDRSSSKSPDNQSVYQSLKSLQSEAFKNKLVRRHQNQKIFNLKTEIKQFSIDGSQGDGQISLGAFESQNRSKGLHRKVCEHQKQKRLEKVKNRQLTSKPKNSKKQLNKKKVVHSVFPQQFYPLKQTKKIGFELPRIGKK